MAAITPSEPMLSVVVPLYNEEGNIAPLLDRMTDILQRLP